MMYGETIWEKLTAGDERVKIDHDDDDDDDEKDVNKRMEWWK